jgi:hypothetical protein
MSAVYSHTYDEKMYKKFREGYDYNKPTSDGDIRHYVYYDTAANKKLIFVNGIGNTAVDHQYSCVDLMHATGCEVLGVYNQSGFANPAKKPSKTRVVQRAIFRGAMRGLMSAFVPFTELAGKETNETINNTIDDIGQCGRDDAMLLSRKLAGYKGRSFNDCTNSLCDLLLNLTQHHSTEDVYIVAHSQGNLITSEAILQYYAFMADKSNKNPAMRSVLSKNALKIYVFAVASPALVWKDAACNSRFDYCSYYHQYDVVPTILSIGATERAKRNGRAVMTKVSTAHSFSSYLQDKRLVNDICRKMHTRPCYPNPVSSTADDVISSVLSAGQTSVKIAASLASNRVLL